MMNRDLAIECFRHADPNYRLCFLSLNGSRLYGTNRPTSDWDYVGACVEPPKHYLGLSKPFEQYMPKGDYYEGTVYSLRKFVYQLTKANPSTLATIYNPNPELDTYNICTDTFRSWLLTRRAADSFFGYATQQLHRLQTNTGMHTTRADLVEKHGYDTKYASHVIRLCRQGIEYLKRGYITVPCPEADLDAILAVLNGGMRKEFFFEFAELELGRLREAEISSRLPGECQWEKINNWLIDVYRSSLAA